MFRKYLEPRRDKRPQSLNDSFKFLDDRWLTKPTTDRNSGVYEDDSLCPSMYSFHSSQEEKDKLLQVLAEYGLETTVDRTSKRDRIKQWINCSVINEEEEPMPEETPFHRGEASSDRTGSSHQDSGSR